MPRYKNTHLTCVYNTHVYYSNEGLEIDGALCV